MDTAPGNLSPKGIHCHSRHAHRVEVRCKENPRLPLASGKSADDIGTTGQHLIELDVGTAVLEQFRDATGTVPLAGGPLPGSAVGIDTGNADQLLEQRDRIVGKGHGSKKGSEPRFLWNRFAEMIMDLTSSAIRVLNLKRNFLKVIFSHERSNPSQTVGDDFDGSVEEGDGPHQSACPLG